MITATGRKLIYETKKHKTRINRTSNVSTYNTTSVAVQNECYVLRVSAASVSQYAMRMRHIVTCGLTSSPILPHIKPFIVQLMHM